MNKFSFQRFHPNPIRRGAKLSHAMTGLAILAAAVLLAACGARTPTPAVLPTSASTLPPLPTLAPTSATTQAPAGATSLDPCQLVPAAEASKLAGATFGPGEAETDIGGMKKCTYGANTANVLTVEVVEAPDTDTAQAQKGQFMAQLQAAIPQLASNGLNIIQLPNLGDGAILGQASLASINVNGGAIAVAKGKVFFGFSDLVQGGPAPTSQALQDEATLVLGRLP